MELKTVKCPEHDADASQAEWLHRDFAWCDAGKHIVPMKPAKKK